MLSSFEIDQKIYNIAIQNGFNPNAAKLIVAQARFESADYTSPVFQKNNNTSGMKYIGQPLAVRGSLAPYNERSSSCKNNNVCVNSDYYAKFNSVEDSAKDKIERLYNRTLNGVTPEQLKNATDPITFATLLKQRGYYGFGKYGTNEADKEIKIYSGGLQAKLRLINVQEFIVKNKTVLGGSLLGVLMIIGAYYLYKNRNRI